MPVAVPRVEVVLAIGQSPGQSFSRRSKWFWRSSSASSFADLLWWKEKQGVREGGSFNPTSVKVWGR